MAPVLTFAVRRRDPLLVGPARPTPRETKRVSDLDDREVLRRQIPNVCFYRGRAGADPVGVIRRALGEALVPYYPLAGRLREVEGRRLVVDCTGEGVLFVEADADVRLAELEAATGLGLRPPFPCMDQLLYDVEGSGGVVGCPLLLIQVTRLLCGGFALAFRINHVMFDATGVTQFVSAVAELARGLPSPTVAPAWSRELLNARGPPPPREPLMPPHRDDAAPTLPAAFSGMALQTFTFSPADVAALKNALPPRLRDKATTFDVLTAAAWRARTAALEVPPGEEVGLAFMANVRGLPELGLPAGYYGNACVALRARATAGALRGGSLGDAVAQVREAKAAMLTAEHVWAVAARRRRPPVVLTANDLFVSDIRGAGFHRVDLGWGEPVYGGTAAADLHFGASMLLPVRSIDGEEKGLALTMVLPPLAMGRFASEVDTLLASLVASAAVPETRAKL
ncbi:unnamed protein product [Urochloa decumbens]|uniref:Benzyl alcohol O-benzoyltransferase n=1 Tax=Urochloa decumbens TaxID=240449 RepID=A0ABC8VSA7_9POAL